MSRAATTALTALVTFAIAALTVVVTHASDTAILPAAAHHGLVLVGH